MYLRLLIRPVLGSFVIDHKEVTRNFPEGLGIVELVCIDAAEQGLIQIETFGFAPIFLTQAAL